MKKIIFYTLTLNSLICTLICGCEKKGGEVLRLTLDMNKDTIEVLANDSCLGIDVSELGTVDFVHIMNKSDHAYEFYQFETDSVIYLSSSNVLDDNDEGVFFLRKKDIYLMLIGSKVVEGNDTLLEVKLKNFIKPV